MTDNELTYLESCSIAAIPELMKADPFTMLHTDIAQQAWLLARAMLAERNKVLHVHVANILQAGVDNKNFKGVGKKKVVEPGEHGGC